MAEKLKDTRSLYHVEEKLAAWLRDGGELLELIRDIREKETGVCTDTKKRDLVRVMSGLLQQIEHAAVPPAPRLGQKPNLPPEYLFGLSGRTLDFEKVATWYNNGAPGHEKIRLFQVFSSEHRRMFRSSISIHKFEDFLAEYMSDPKNAPPKK